MNWQRYLAHIFYAPYPDIVWNGAKEKNAIYLTFDDGPHPPLTAPLLKYLNKKKIAATFFLSGHRIDEHKKAAKKLNYKIHSLGNHAYDHIPLIGMKSDQVLEQLNRTDEAIVATFDRAPTLFRPPFGIFGKQTLAAVKQTGKTLINWSLMANDFKWERDRILAHLYKHVRSGDVIVFHDSPQTEHVLMDVVPPFVEHCKKRGFTFAKF